MTLSPTVPRSYIAQRREWWCLITLWVLSYCGIAMQVTVLADSAPVGSSTKLPLEFWGACLSETRAKTTSQWGTFFFAEVSKDRLIATHTACHQLVDFDFQSHRMSILAGDGIAGFNGDYANSTLRN